MREGSAGIVWTTNQTAGKGRADRVWICPPGDALAVSFRFDAYKDHPAPYLVGMALAIMIAEEFGLKVQWPNDIVFKERKLAGILTEVVDGVPVVGLGLNLLGAQFPSEIEHRAVSLEGAKGVQIAPKDALRRIITKLKSTLLEPTSWASIRSAWHEVDRTPGKTFTLPDGRKVVSQSVSENGHLVWMSGTETGITSLAEAYYGRE